MPQTHNNGKEEEEKEVQVLAAELTNKDDFKYVVKRNNNLMCKDTSHKSLFYKNRSV